MKPVYVKSSIYIDFSKIFNDQDPKFKIGDIVRISKYKNIFAKGYTLNWSEEISMIKKLKNTGPWTCVTNDLNREKITGTIYQKCCKKQIKNEKN